MWKYTQQFGLRRHSSHHVECLLNKPAFKFVGTMNRVLGDTIVLSNYSKQLEKIPSLLAAKTQYLDRTKLSKHDLS